MSIIDGDRSRVTSVTRLRSAFPIAAHRKEIMSSLRVQGMAAASVPGPPCPSLLVRKVHTSPLLKQVSSMLMCGPMLAPLK